MGIHRITARNRRANRSSAKPPAAISWSSTWSPTPTVDEQIDAPARPLHVTLDVDRATADGDAVTIDSFAARNKDGADIRAPACRAALRRLGHMLDGLDEGIVSLEEGRALTTFTKGGEVEI